MILELVIRTWRHHSHQINNHFNGARMILYQSLRWLMRPLGKLMQMCRHNSLKIMSFCYTVWLVFLGSMTQRMRPGIQKIQAWAEAYFRFSSNQSKESTPYTYKPLKADREIRLLRISRRFPLTHIRITLLQVPLSELPAYQCISYVWGDAAKTKSIFIDEHELPVSQKVYEIFNEEGLSIITSGMLWIDSVYINQADNEEKNKQVRLMCEIYKRLLMSRFV
jgi:hypothetical protein